MYDSVLLSQYIAIVFSEYLTSASHSCWQITESQYIAIASPIDCNTKVFGGITLIIVMWHHPSAPMRRPR